MNVGAGIKKIRLEKELSQGELATLAKIAQTTLSQIEKGKRKPSEKNLQKICEALKVPEQVIYLYSFEDVDIPERKRDLFNKLFPPFQDLIKQVLLDD